MLKTNSVYFFDSAEFEEIIMHYLNSGKVSLAKKAIDLGLKQHPTSINLKLSRIEVLIFEEKFDQAATMLTKLEKIEPSNDQIYLHKATLFSKKDMHKEAIQALNKALLFAEDELDILSMIGMEYLFLDDYETARLNFAKCLEVEYDDYSSLYNIIYCFDMEQKHHEAIDYLDEYINNEPFCEIAWHQLGRQYYILDKYDEALRAFDYAIIIDEDFLGAYIEKAKTLEALERFEEAIDHYMVAIQLEDGTPFIYLRLGLCYEKINDKKQALKYYNLTIKEDPLLEKGWLALTSLYVKEKNYQKALFFINKALNINNENAAYWSRFAEINIKLNLFEEAANAFQKCIDLEDYRLDIFIALIDVLHFLGEYKDALLVLKKAKKLYTDFAEIEYRLSGMNFLVQNEKNGLRYLKNALKLDYDYHEIMKELYPSVFDIAEVNALLEKK
ncbi:MAG: tetratricopeptide repeat protein [Flavobacteriaceae bacterium]|nr:tetratricopeptide repeat protein [Flavobacteriaceae bacterium]